MVALYHIIHSQSTSLALYRSPSSTDLQRRRRYNPHIPSLFFSAVIFDPNKKAMALVSRVAGNHMIDAVVQLMTDVINEKDSHQILQIESGCMEILRQDIGLFQSQQQGLPEEVKIWLQLLHNSLAEAKRLLHRSGRRQRCLDWLVNNPIRQSQQIRGWNAFFNHLFQGFEIDLFQHIVLSRETVNSHIMFPIMELLIDVIKEEDKLQIMQTDLRPLEILLQDFTTLFPDESHIITLFQGQEKRHPMTQLRLLQISLAEAKCLLDRSGPRQRSCLDRVNCNPRRLSEKATVLNAFFDRFYHVLQSELPMLVTSLQFLSSKPLLRKERVAASVFVDGQPLSGDEAWMLFRRVAFKDVRVSMDIEERARIIADECKGRPLAINVVAASMVGQGSAEEWDNCLSSVKKVDPSFPPTHPLLDAELYRLLRWSYDSLPNSNVKNCFLYCAFYEQGQEIDSRQLVEMWIGEGLIKSKQGAYSMDMAIGRSYVKLLLHRSLFHIVNQSGTNVFRRRSTQAHDVFPSIGVKDAIREMAMYIAQKEENCFFMRGQNPPNLPEADYAKCRRISFPDNFSGALPTDLRCPNLTTLILQGNRHLELPPTELLLSRLTSLRVLNLSGCTEITSVPTSMGQLRLLQFLLLSRLPIRYLGEEVCHLSELQFLDLSWCGHLESLPSQIGQLKNLKHLNLDGCYSLEMIPREISELPSLSRLQLHRTLSVRMEAPASVWSLKGLQKLTELKVWVDQPLKDGIMGTWSEMRHLALWHSGYQNITENLPDDMQNMKKLQTLFLGGHPMLSLTNCKFEHLETVKLYDCDNIKELSALEWLPNLKVLKLWWCPALSELGIGSRVPSGYLRLEKLVLKRLEILESVGGPSSTGEWDERTLPHLRVLKIRECPHLKRLPIGMEKLRNLCAIEGSQEWWGSIMWEDPHMKFQLQKIFVKAVNG